MQGHYAAEFTREHGCTEAEWLGWLPGAVRGATLQPSPAGTAELLLDAGGRLLITWQALPPRRIALATLPRMTVHYRFDGTSDEARHAFMRYFDLYMQRGGG